MSTVEKSDTPEPTKGQSACFNCAYHGGEARGLLQRPSLLVCKRFPPSGYTDVNSAWRWPLVNRNDRCGEWRSRATEGWMPRKVKMVEGYAPEVGGERSDNSEVRRWMALSAREKEEMAKANPEAFRRIRAIQEREAAQAWEGMSEESRKRAKRLMPQRAQYMLRCWERHGRSPGGNDGGVAPDGQDA